MWTLTNTCSSYDKIYSLKDGQVTWHEHIKAALKEHGFPQPKIGPCLFIKEKVILVLYIDNDVFFSPRSKAIDNEIILLKKAFNLTDEGELKDYVGTPFIHDSDGQIKLQQQKTINNCLNLLGLVKM